MFAYQPFRGDSKQKAPSSLQELEVTSSDHATEAVSTNSATVKPITDTLKETTGNKETINTENQTDSQIKVEKDEQKMRDIAVGKN